MNRISLTTLIIWMVLAVTACKKWIGGEEEDLGGDPNEIIIGSSKTRPGLGPTAGMPDGTDLQLPACVQLVKRSKIRFTPDASKLYGSSQAFYVALSFINTCPAPAQVELPAGLILIAEHQTDQNALLVERTRINVPPTFNSTGGADTTTIFLAVNCLNKTKSPPLDDINHQDYNLGYSYSIGKVTNDANLLKLLALLADKPGLKATDFMTNDPASVPTTDLEKMYAEIQAAIWSVTDGNGLTRADVSKLKSMLNAFK